MAKDDFFVIAYKILSYLYECNKTGKHPAIEDFNYHCAMFSIPESYWQQIMGDLIDKGYISGASKVECTERSQPGIKINPGVAITMDGVEFLQENSKMKKVKDFLGEGFTAALSGIIALL